MHAATVLLTIAFFSFCFFYIFTGTKIRRHGQPLKQAPNTLPLLGNGILFLQARHKLFSWFVRCERQFGFETFQISVPSLPPGVVINDPKNLEFVLKNEGIFAKGAFFKRRSWDLFGNGIINADGDLWKLQRKSGLQFLSKANLRVLIEIALPEYLEEIIRDTQVGTIQTVVNLEDVFHELTTQIMGKLAYNMEIHNSDPFSEAFDYASGATGQRFQNPLWQITEVFSGRRFRRSVSIVKEFGSTIVANAVKSRGDLTSTKSTSLTDQPEAITEISGSLINALLDSIKDEQMVADAALNYLSAGRDTTAQALTWTFYLLMRHPEITNEIFVEISRLVDAEDKPFSSSGSQLVLHTSIFRPLSLPYVTSVFYEALRLFPPVPFELKQCEEATTLPDGTFLPKESIVVWCTWAMNRSALIWGEDSGEFKPKRWLDGNKLISRTASEYPVFNGGSRTCLGKHMAELLAVQVIATLIWTFEFEPLDTHERISKNSLTLPMEGGLPCRFKLRRHGR